MATLCLFEINIFQNEAYDVIIHVHSVIKKILLSESDYIVVVVM